jgi:hypothetical protein
MLFACRLKNVGYIWIDSLCIKQQSADPAVDPSEPESDWLEQSRVMDNIYSSSYLNISATAAADGDQGLFFRRRPDDLWEDEINLNLTGLINPEQTEVNHEVLSGIGGVGSNGKGKGVLSGHKSSHAGNKRRIGDNYNDDSPRKLLRIGTESIFDAPRMVEQVGHDYLKRCTIIDAAFWDNLVEQAPVNQRGWVLQERVMAPRVLHFCHNQIAWECSEFQDAEGHPEGFPTFTIRLGNIVDEGRLKSLTRKDSLRKDGLKRDGLRLRDIRLNGFADPDKSLRDLHIYELWKRIVEIYSRTTLTISRDKLVALSGIAKLFSGKLFSKQTKCEYVAGMWREHLESQLLWHVKEDFKDGHFLNQAKRDPARAPSFSWAALDTPCGIVYGEVTDYGRNPSEELLFKVQDHKLFYLDPENSFGLIEGSSGFIVVEPRFLRKIDLRKLQPPQRVPYCWRLTYDPPKEAGTDHFNLYLDAPETDVDVFQKGAELYCMPAAYGGRTVKKSSRYLICLLLLELEKEKSAQENTSRSFKRFGLTKLSNYADREGQKALMECEFDEKIYIR